MSEDNVKYGTSRDELIAQQRRLVAICQADASDRRFPDRSEAVKSLAVAVDKLATLTTVPDTVSATQYGILAQAVADVVNGHIGGKLGLGLKPPPAGAVARF